MLFLRAMYSHEQGCLAVRVYRRTALIAGNVRAITFSSLPAVLPAGRGAGGAVLWTWTHIRARTLWPPNTSKGRAAQKSCAALAGASTSQVEELTSARHYISLVVCSPKHAKFQSYLRRSSQCPSALVRRRKSQHLGVTSQCLDNGLHRPLGITKEHGSVLFEEQGILNAGVAGCH